ncbi:hypothetical protein HanPSC8_Chr15g0679691 [Helianthus annuus]|uniref:Uncharacterized protein n=1 Tax=Helianthus annuus TaxID=4232 RepID=A0A251SBV0_HELAN|nr:hypothetical protein HanPSC8_Chr15g0679691 [Helianthus annuus]
MCNRKESQTNAYTLINGGLSPSSQVLNMPLLPDFSMVIFVIHIWVFQPESYWVG